MICIKCEKEIPDGSLFCMHCGAKQTPKKKKTSKRANGTGTAYKKNGKYVARWVEGWYFDKNGKAQPKRTTKGGFASKTEALKYAQNHAVQRKDLYVRPKTIKDLWLEIEPRLFSKLSKDKITQYQLAYTRLNKIVNIPLEKITTSQIQNCVNEQNTTYYPARDMKTVLSHIYKEGIRQDIVTQNLSKNIELPPLNAKEADAFTYEEIKKLWDYYHTNNTFAGYILLMIYTGMMPQEIRDLTPEMIDLEARTIYGCGAKTEERKKRKIALAEDIIPVVKTLIDNAKSSDAPIFGYAKQKFYDLYHETLKAAGIRDIVPYSARHTTANELMKGGIKLDDIKGVMRHKNMETTLKYFTDDLVDQHKAVNVIGHNKN